jgi:hypothetical protein
MSNANNYPTAPPSSPIPEKELESWPHVRIRNDYDYSAATPPEFKAGDRVTVNYVTSERNGSKRITGKGTIVKHLPGGKSQIERSSICYKIQLDDGSIHYICEGMTPQMITKISSGGKRRKQTRKRKNKKLTRRYRR